MDDDMYTGWKGVLAILAGLLSMIILGCVVSLGLYSLGF